MACTHVESCPLFPLLSASLPDWIAAYCEGERDGRDCARYQLAERGQVVPITLLPNGRSAHAFASRVAEDHTAVEPAAVRSPVPQPTVPPATLPLPRPPQMYRRDHWWARIMRWLMAPA